VPPDTVQSLKIMVATDGPIATGSTLCKGDRVMVIAGPFAGVVGIFDRYQGQNRVVVFIEALGQYAAVEVDADDVEKIPSLQPA
jgi:transcription antitermination factor NusG